MKPVQPTCGAVLLALMLPVPGLAQPREYRSAGLDGATGLFAVWDAEPLRSGELNLSLALNRHNLDPGKLQITGLPVAGAVGLFGVLEFFGALDVQKRITAENIGVYRVAEGQRPRPAVTPLGAASLSSEAPFIDVPESTGRGNFRGGVKIGVLSERRGHPFALSGVIFGEVPTQATYSALNRGLGSRTLTGGFGALISKRFGEAGQLPCQLSRGPGPQPARGVPSVGRHRS